MGAPLGCAQILIYGDFMNDKIDRLTASLSAAVCLCYLAVFCIINFCGFCRFCTPDMYSDVYLSTVMWETGSIFPENWIFGNQFYVVSTPVLAALFYGLCGSANLAMVLATTVMTALILLSFFWMVRPFAGRSQILLGMAVLLGSVFGAEIVTTIEGQIFYLMASYYAGYLITLFVVFGDYTRALAAAPVIPSLLLALVLSFCTGMQSLRQTALMTLPLVGFESIRLLLQWKGRNGTLRWNWQATLRVGLYAIANLAGRVAIKLLDPNCVTMYGKLTFNSLKRLPELLFTCLRCIRSISGLKYLWPGTFLLGITALVLVSIVGISLYGQLRRPGKRDGLELLLMLFVCSILCVLSISVVVNIYTRSIYIFPWYPMAAVAVMILAGKCPENRKRLLTVLTLTVLMANLVLSYVPTVRKACETEQPPRQEVAQYLMDEGYDIVYGPWMPVAEVAVWTDGQVAAGSWYQNICEVIPYITPTDIFTEADNARACYLTTNVGEEEALLTYAADSGGSMTLVKRFEETGFALYACDKQLMHFPQS